MRARFLAFFATLTLSIPNVEAATLRFDYDSFNRGGGYFVVDTATFTVTATVITTGPGLLGGADYTHYTGGSIYPFSGTSTISCPGACEAIFTTQGSGASSGLVTLTLSFANALVDRIWTSPQPVSILELHSRATATTGSWQGIGLIERTVLVADPPSPSPVPLPPALLLHLLVCLSLLALLAWGRRGTMQSA